MRGPAAAVSLVALLSLAPAGVAQARVLDRAKAGDGTEFVVSVADTLQRRRTGRIARFELAVNVPPDPRVPYAVGGGVSVAEVAVAGARKPVRVRSRLECRGGGVVLMHGTVGRAARRVVARFRGARSVRLARRRPPRRWRYRGWVVGQVVRRGSDPVDVRAYDARGRRIGLTRFVGGQSCR